MCQPMHSDKTDIVVSRASKADLVEGWPLLGHDHCRMLRQEALAGMWHLYPRM